MDRRRFLTVAAGTAALAATTPALAKIVPWSQIKTRELSLHNLHTGDRTNNALFWAENEYIDAGLSEMNFVVRDWRRNEVADLNPKVYDLLHELKHRVGDEITYDVISGYRSPATNEQLRGKRTNTGVAKKSLHMTGDAIDIRVPGVKLRHLRDLAWDLQLGGVGYYEKSNFIHVDVGRVRRWGF